MILLLLTVVHLSLSSQKLKHLHGCALHVIEDHHVPFVPSRPPQKLYQRIPCPPGVVDLSSHQCSSEIVAIEGATNIGRLQRCSVLCQRCSVLCQWNDWYLVISMLSKENKVYPIFENSNCWEHAQGSHARRKDGGSLSREREAGG